MQSAYKIHNSEKVQSPSSDYNLDFFTYFNMIH